MALKVFLKREEVPKSVRIVDSSDGYFFNTPLKDTPFVREVISEIDKSKYVNEQGFESRVSAGMWIPKEMLSTGAKTLINIALWPDVCFNVILCGRNALAKMLELHDGMVLWEGFTPIIDRKDCDIEYDGKIFDHLGVLARYVDEKD